jgi:hypothetical protein
MPWHGPTKITPFISNYYFFIKMIFTCNPFWIFFYLEPA